MRLHSTHSGYISAAELAKILGISHVAVFKRIKSGKIKAIKIGRTYAIPRSYAGEEVPAPAISLKPENQVT